MKLDHFSTPDTHTHTNSLSLSQWIRDLNVRPEIIKFLEENIGSNFVDISYRNIFLVISPQARETKAKLDYWHYSKIKSFCNLQI